MKQSFFILFLFITATIFSQNITVSGYIYDAKSKESLIGANIYTEDFSTGISTNEYGFFSLTLKKRETRLIISNMGYKTKEIEINSISDTTLNIFLEQTSINISQIDIIANPLRENLRKPQSGSFRLSNKEIRNLSPPLMGEADVFKSIQKMPGIQPGREGSTDLFVRGGNSGENLILLDGVPVYYTAHLLGMLSVFNTDAIKNVNFIKGGFPAHYGGRLSSIADIRLKEGNKEKLTGNLDIGIISSKLTMEGPINKKSSFIISGRTTPLSYLSLMAEKIGKTEINFYHFYDFTSKINYRINERNKLFLSFYTGEDRFLTRFGKNGSEIGDYLSSFGINWGNRIALFRYNRQWNKKIFSNLSLVYSRYLMQSANYISGFDSIQNEKVSYKKKESYNSGLNDIGVLFNLDYQINNNFFLKSGFSFTHKKFTPNAISYENIQRVNNDTLIDKFLANNLETKVLDMHTYIENQIQIFENLSMNIGVHYNQFFVQDSFYYSIEPRLALSCLISPYLSLKFSYARMSQNIHLLGNSGVGFPTDIWVPSTRKIKPEFSDQFTFGTYAQWDEKWQVSLETYYKTLKNVVDFSQGTNFLKNGQETNLLKETEQNWENRLSSGKGEAYGVEFYLKRQTKVLTYSFAYTFSNSWRQFDNINRGLRYPFRYNRKHVFNFDINYTINSKITLNAAWQYMSGFYVSLPLRKYMAGFYSPAMGYDNFYVVQEIGMKNNFKLPAYHRLDLSISYRKIKRHGTAVWLLGVYNAYNRKNAYTVIPIGVSYDEISQISLFPILPSISYRYIFK